MRFFLDNCLSPHHAAGLAGFARADGHEFLHLRDAFEPDTPDHVWIKELGDEGNWLILSGDLRITKSPLIRQAWIESELTAFFFSPPWMNDAYWTKTAALVRWWPAICAQAKKTPKGHGFIMPKKGSELQRLFPK